MALFSGFGYIKTQIYSTRSSGRYVPFLLAPAEGWGGGPLWGPPPQPSIFLDPSITFHFSHILSFIVIMRYMDVFYIMLFIHKENVIVRSPGHLYERIIIFPLNKHFIVIMRLHCYHQTSLSVSPLNHSHMSGSHVNRVHIYYPF